MTHVMISDMTPRTNRPHVTTDNQRYGSGHLDEDAPGGVWIVFKGNEHGHDVAIRHCFSGRAPAEAYIYDQCETEGHDISTYCMQVWSVSETWPDEEELED